MSFKLLGTANQSYQTRNTVYTADAYGIVTVSTSNMQDITDLINSSCIPLGAVQARSNLTATADPAASNDNTQDYGVGSMWVNSTNGRVWICQSATTNAAAWALAIVPGVGIEPSTNIEQFGSGTATMLSEGNIYRFLSTSAAGSNPAGTNADVVVAAYSLPANSFDAVGRILSLCATGNFANNTNSKRAKIIWNPSTAVVGQTVGTGGVVLVDTGPYNTTGAAAFDISGNIWKAASNSQILQSTGVIIGSTHTGTGAGTGVAQAASAVDTGTILIAVTLNAVTQVSDAALNFFEINAMN